MAACREPHRLFLLGRHDRLQDALELAVGLEAERRQGKTQAVAHQPEAAQRALQGNRVGLEEQRGMERRQELLVPLDVGVQPLVASPVQGRAEHRHDVGRHRDAAVAAGQAERRLAGIVAGQQQELIAQPAAQARHPRDVAGGVLEADDARQLGEPPDRHVVQRAGGARGHVVEDDGKADCVVDGAEVHHHAGLGRLEIGRRDAEQRRGAGAFGRARQLDRRGRVVAAGAGDHRHAPGGRRDRPRHDAMMLVGRQQRRLAGRAARHEGRLCRDRSGDCRRPPGRRSRPCPWR